MSHQVRLIDLIGVADDGHLFLEKDRESKTGLVVEFLHMKFLLSSWIREIIRFTVSTILSSFGLLVRGFLFRPHGSLKSGSRWSFFIGYSPVEQSLQEYLGVLVHDPVRSVSGIILKGCPDGVGLR